jgi:hypothetical protein
MPVGRPRTLNLVTRNLATRNSAATSFSSALIKALGQRAAIRADLWAMRYRVMTGSLSGPFTFDYHPWTREMLCSDHPENVGQKAAQMGFTDSVCLNRALYTIAQQRLDVLYILPSQTPDARDFSSGRFDPALQASDYLAELFTDANNVGMKRTATNVLYVRGSRSRSQLKSIPVSLIIMDEVDEFDPEAIRLAEERTSGQLNSQMWQISTPSVPNYGVNALFRRSDQRRFFFPCPHCGKRGELSFPDSLVITADDPNDSKIQGSYLQCSLCKSPFHPEEKRLALQKGEWVAEHPQNFARGYHVNQLYSTVIPIWKIGAAALRAQSDPVEEQEFYNSKLGLEHIVAGHSLTPEHIVRSEEKMRSPQLWKYQTGRNAGKDRMITMGIDVGKVLHVEVDAWTITGSNSTSLTDNARPAILWAGTIQHFAELDSLMYLFKPLMSVIDAQPETREALAFCRRFPGVTRVCYYSDGLTGADVSDNGERITAQRTTALDKALGRFYHGNIVVPNDVPSDYVTHLCALVRKPERNKLNELTYRYLNTGADHFAHTRTYCELAMQILAPSATTALTERM